MVSVDQVLARLNNLEERLQQADYWAAQVTAAVQEVPLVRELVKRTNNFELQVGKVFEQLKQETYLREEAIRAEGESRNKMISDYLNQMQVQLNFRKISKVFI